MFTKYSLAVAIYRLVNLDYEAFTADEPKMGVSLEEWRRRGQTCFKFDRFVLQLMHSFTLFL